jgi:hypothetical protein
MAHGKRLQRLKNGSLPARLHVFDEIRALLLLFDSCEDHLGAWNVLFRIDQVLEHVLVGPNNAGVLIRFGVREALQGARLAAKDAPQRWSLLGIASLLDGVALRTLPLEELRALLHVALGHFDVWLFHRHVEDLECN